MGESFRIEGVDVVSRGGKYVVVFGPDYAVHCSQTGKTWVARKPFALEPVCCAKTLNECVRLAKRHYDALANEARQRARLRIESALSAYDCQP